MAMALTVQASSDEVPGLVELIEDRRSKGLDLFDEWWEGVYRIVPVPGPRHGDVVAELTGMLLPRARDAGLRVRVPMNIGVHEQDVRVPDIGIVRPDVPMTSPAYHAGAELVVEVLSPGEQPGAKLPFYAEWNVKEYLEVEAETGACRLLRHHDGDWRPVSSSSVLDLDLADIEVRSS